MDFSISCMLIASDMEYLNSYLKYSFKVDDYYEDNNNHELEVLEVSKVQEEEEYHESEEEEKEYQRVAGYRRWILNCWRRRSWMWI